MSVKYFQSRDFSFGINSQDAPHQMDVRYAVVAKNMTVGPGYIETRNGLTLFNQDLTKTGGITAMVAAYFRGGTKQLVFANDDDWYSLTPSATTTTAWGTVGDMGTAVTNPFGYLYKNYVCFGTGSASNVANKWDGTTYSLVGTPADASCDLRFYEYHQGANVAYLLGSGDVRDNATHNRDNVYYSIDPNDWATGGGIITVGSGDGQAVTAIKSHSDIVVFKENSAYRLDVVYESNSGTNILRVLERFQDIGALNQETTQVVFNDVVSICQRLGVRGYNRIQTNLGGSSSRALSSKLKPLLNTVNWPVAKLTGRAVVWDNKVFISLPFNGANTNNGVLVAHLTHATDIGEFPWTAFEMNVGSFCIFQDANSQERLMVGDSNSPKIYFWDVNSLSDNQQAITCQYTTKRMDMGDLEVDSFDKIVLGGTMSEPTEIKVTVEVDGFTADYVIKKEQIINSASPIWSHVVGSEVVGGNSLGGAKSRWVAVLPITDACREGAEIQLTFRSSGKGYFWRLDAMSINSPINENLFPDTAFVSDEY